MIRKISAGVVIFRRENGRIKYLLLHYIYEERPRHWDFPRGGIEKNEKSIETAKREIWEESGIKYLKFISGFKESIRWFYKRKINFRVKSNGILKNKAKTITVFKTAIFYLAELKKGKVKISFEHVDYKWLPRDEALECLTFKNAKNVLKKANQFFLKYYEKKK